MQPFKRVNGVAAIIPGRNIDTDQIIPGRFLKADRSKGYGNFLFHDLRFDAEGHEKPGFILNREPFREAPILVTDDNFGCGSSREGAVYALQDYGIRALIGTSFGDIFYSNCLKNGILPVRLDAELMRQLRGLLEGEEGAAIDIDLTALQVTFPDGSVHAFEVDPFWRTCLLEGVDDLQLTLRHSDQIEGFIADYSRAYPWAMPKEKAGA